LILSTIHRFEGIDKDANTRDNIYVFIDEAHRSVAKELGTYLMAAVRNATIIGFTGTPIARTAQGEGTFKIFGTDDAQGYLDKYSIRESIEDETTLPLRHTMAPSDITVPADRLDKEFFDLADAYGSHPFFKSSVKGIPREQYIIQTKTDNRDPSAVRKDIDRFMQELGTDYIDSLIIHCVTEGDWDTRYRGVMDVISEAKEKGKVRAHGVTCHSFEALKAAAASDWVQINQIRWNPKAAHMDAGVETARSLFKSMRAKGQGMIGMKVVGQGDLVNGSRKLSPEECFRFQIESGVVDAFVVGVERIDHIDVMLRGTQLALNELGYRASPSMINV